MRHHLILLPALGLAVALGLTPGCSSPDTPPLGGPYGGNATVTPPAGSASGSDDGGNASGSSSGGSSGGGGSSSGAASGSSSGGGNANAPTWSQLWTKYMATGTVGGCAQNGCHGDTTKGCASASGCFTWLQVSNGYDYITGGINNNGLFSWTPDGFMPANGPTSNPQAVSDFAAWTAAGSQNN